MIDAASDDALLRKPIIVLGAPRSGTTVVGTILGRHPALVYCDEPRLVWRYGNDGKSDMLRPEDALPEVRAYIRSRLAAAVRAGGGERLVEKTPSNSLRVEFVDRVFPDAKFVHVLRHPIDAILSIRHFWTGFAGGVGHVELRKRVRQRIRELELRRMPHYAAEFARRILPGSLAGPRAWGPRIPGLEAVARERGVLEACALQWRTCVEAACQSGRALGSDRYLECRLEDMGRDQVKRILEFCEVEDDPAIWRSLETEFDPSLAGARRPRADPEEERRIETWIEPTAAWLGYGGRS